MPAQPLTGPRALLDRLPSSTRALQVAALANLVVQVGIVVTGGLVRLTGSGLGCPTWPQCVPGSYTPVAHQAQGIHKDIEFGNRLLTFVVLVAALAVLAVALRWRRGPQARTAAPGAVRRVSRLAGLPLLGVFAQAVLGGVTVLLGLNPASVAAHFMLSMVLVAVSTALWLAAGPCARWPVPVRPELRGLAAGLGLVLLAVLVLGTVVTGSGPHSGDAQTPTRFGFDPAAVSWLHADAVWLFVGLVLAALLALRLTGAPAAVVRRAGWLLAATVAQGAIGYTQYLLGLPTPLVALHMLGASLLVVATVSVLLPVLLPGRDGLRPGEDRARTDPGTLTPAG